MSEPINDGGPAFPSAGILTPDGIAYEGMSLHDWYKGKAMQAILSNPNVNPLEIGDKIIADLSNFFANAMLSDRKQP